MKTSLYCIILNYRHHHDTANCLRALQNADPPPNTKFIIVDNSPDLISVDYLQQAFPKVDIIHNHNNLGFAAGNNVGIRRALKNGASHILIINPDVTVGKKFFTPLLTSLADNSNLGLVAPAVRHTQKGKTFYGLEGHLNWQLAKATHTNLTRLSKSTQLRPGDFISFACVLVKANVFSQIGLLDERYFMYLEDVDFSLTAKKAGFSCAVDPRVVVDHQTSSSFAKPVDKLKISLFSQLKFCLKWLSFPHNLISIVYYLFFYPYLYLLWTHQAAGSQPLSVTAVVLTKDSQPTLARCLRSLRWCTQVVVVDDHSTDVTVSLARKLGARVFRRHLSGDWSAQRNFGLSKARSNWVLFIDSDEVVSWDLQREIISALRRPLHQGFYLRRLDVLFGRILRFGETAHVRLLRLAKKDSSRWVRPVHEVWQVRGSIGQLRQPILHRRQLNISRFLDRLNLYTSLETQPFHWPDLLKPKVKFVKNYFFLAGLLDGFTGFVIAYLMSLNSLIARVKSWEKQRL